MNSYQLPSSAFETVHCRQEEVPKDCDKTEWLGKAVADENNRTIAYDPVVERHIRDSLQSREYTLHSIHGWKEVLLNQLGDHLFICGKRRCAYIRLGQRDGVPVIF